MSSCKNIKPSHNQLFFSYLRNWNVYIMSCNGRNSGYKLHWQCQFLSNTHTNTLCLLVAFLPSLCTHFFRSMKLCAVRELGFSTLMKLISSTEKFSSLASSASDTDNTKKHFLRECSTSSLTLRRVRALATLEIWLATQSADPLF